MQTNFAALTANQKMVWSRLIWKEARDLAFINRFMGDGTNAIVQRITELTKTEKGEQVIMHLLADLVEDGVVGDDEREGNEEAMESYNDIIEIDLISHGVRSKGKMADQKTVINFRENGRDRLAYWLANRIDQLAFLTLSGIGYDFKNDGSARIGNFKNLAFAHSVTAPSAKRFLRWDAAGAQLLPGDTTAVVATDFPTYKMLVDLHAYAKDHYIRPLIEGGKEYYCVFMKPQSLAELKKDPDYQRAVVTGWDRGKDNPFFSGAIITIDGLVLHEHRLVYSTKGAASGSKWGAGGLVNGTRTLLCGAQALGIADLGPPEWNEKTFNYGAQAGINIDKMFGLLKPRFHSIYDGTVEDFGVIAVDHAIKA